MKEAPSLISALSKEKATMNHIGKKGNTDKEVAAYRPAEPEVRQFPIHTGPRRRRISSGGLRLARWPRVPKKLGPGFLGAGPKGRNAIGRPPHPDYAPASGKHSACQNGNRSRTLARPSEGWDARSAFHGTDRFQALRPVHSPIRANGGLVCLPG